MNGKETNHYRHFVETKLQADETPLLFLEGWIGEMMGKGDKLQHNGCFVLTDRRALFIRKGMFGEVFQALPIDRISSVETRSVLGYRVLTLHAANDDLKFKTFESADLFERVYNRVEDLRKANSVASPKSGAEGGSASGAMIETIKKLADLRDAGILTEDEFEQKKRELLNRV